jgi:hypothetical protein
MMFRISSSLAALAASLMVGGGSHAADACSAYKWDVSNEVRLFATTPLGATAGADLDGTQAIETGRLYEINLHPQQAVRFAAPPSKRMLADGAFAGLVKFTVPARGPYRVAVNAGSWLDVVHQGRLLDALDFNGSRECAGPRKIVVYDLPAGTELVLQLSAVTGSTVRLAITPVVPASR